MKVKLEKFGTTLISRELGSEALKAFQPTLLELPANEELEIFMTKDEFGELINKMCNI